MKARAIAFFEKKVVLRDFEMPEPGEGEVLLKTEFTCISPGTELRVLHNDPRPDAYIPGYALVGRVSQSRAAGIKEGELCFCSGTKKAVGLATQWGGHCSHAITTAAALTRVPENVSAQAASLGALGGIAMQGLRMGKVRKGEQVAIVGLGVLGQLSARLHAAEGGRVVACDQVNSRVQQALGAGLVAVQVQKGQTLKQALATQLPQGATLVVDVTGAGPVIPQAIDLVCDLPWTDEPLPDTRYVVQGSYAGEFSIPYQVAFCKRLSFLIPRNYQSDDLKAFFAQLASKRLRVDELLCKIASPEDAPEVFDSFRDPENVPGTIAFDWKY